MDEAMTRIVAEFVADSVNPLLLGVLLPAPFVGARRPAPWRFYAACALGIGIAVGLAEVGKARVVWAGHPGFPSGHATFACAAATCLACRDPRWLAVGVPAVGLLACALIAAHFHAPEDVVGALVLGPTVAGLCHWLVGACRKPARAALIVSACLLSLQPCRAQAPLSYTTSWIGNSFGGAGTVPGTNYHTHVQIGADDVFVASDGTVYTDTDWDENGLETGFYRNGQVAGALEELSHGWGRGGGGAVTANEKYVFAAATQNGDDGANREQNKNGLPQYPPRLTQWDCVRRFTRDGRSAPWPQGYGWKNDMRVVSTVTRAEHSAFPDEAVHGLAADARRLYVSDPAHGRINVYDAETMTRMAQWSCARPGKLAVQGTRLWVLQKGENGASARIVCLDTGTGKSLPQSIIGPPRWDPQGIAVDTRGRLLVADSGPDQNVKLYTGLSGKPTLAATFGIQGGIFSGEAGRFGDRRFNNPVGAGTDARGNLYVWSRGAVAGGGTVLECYAPGGKLHWRLLGLHFIDCAEPDPASPSDVYTKEEHFTLDYGQTTPGREWAYRGCTVNRLKYPDDPRLHTAPTSAFVRHIGGKLFLYTTDMYASELTVSRFSPQTDGECAVPAVLFAKGHIKENGKDWPATQPAGGEWLWHDANSDGRMQAREFEQPVGKADAPGLWGWSVDSRGDVWQATDHDGLRRFPCQGLDAHGSPRYSYAALQTFPMPAPFVELCRIEYQPETDTMYLAGYTTARPHTGGEWGTVGTEIVRYDHWNQGSRTPSLRIALPYDGQKDPQVYIKAMCVSGSYVFAVESRDPERVFVYDARTGALQGTMQPGPEVGKSSGWVDTPYGIRAFERKNGEYLIFVEEDLDAKVLMYRWRPRP